MSRKNVCVDLKAVVVSNIAPPSLKRTPPLSGQLVRLVAHSETGAIVAASKPRVEKQSDHRRNLFQHRHPHGVGHFVLLPFLLIMAILVFTACACSFSEIRKFEPCGVIVIVALLGIARLSVGYELVAKSYKGRRWCHKFSLSLAVVTSARIRTSLL